MDTFFNSVHITNFKSLKDVTLSDCMRINLLIGKPNTGKSNILEAIALFGISQIVIRYENLSELFFDGDTKEDVSVIIKNSDTDVICKIKNTTPNSGFVVETNMRDTVSRTVIPNSGNDGITLNNQLPLNDLVFNIKQYKFPYKFSFEKNYFPYLSTPFGGNLLSVIQEQKIFRVELAKIISEYGWKLNIDVVGNSLRVLKDLGDGIVFTLPYNSIADTLQRLIFYKAAIISNQNSILLFEEPEAHCFPPYIAHFTQEVINSETNQFFIATHSPYVLNDFMEDENTRAELAIYMADFKDGQTVVYRLTDEELNEVYNYGIDVFFNYERFTANG